MLHDDKITPLTSPDAPGWMWRGTKLYREAILNEWQPPGGDRLIRARVRTPDGRAIVELKVEAGGGLVRLQRYFA